MVSVHVSERQTERLLRSMLRSHITHVTYELNGTKQTGCKNIQINRMKLKVGPLPQPVKTLQPTGDWSPSQHADGDADRQIHFMTELSDSLWVCSYIYVNVW